MRFEDRTIDGVGQLLSYLKDDLSDQNEPIWYRGQSDSSWSLDPKLLRDSDSPPESHLINKFKQNASYIIQSGQQIKTEFDWLFMMQHYGVKTRLLDWTESALVGLFFACTSGSDSEGALWILAPCLLNEKSNYRSEYTYEIPSFEDEQLQNYSPKTIASEHKTQLYPMAAIAVRNSPRMHAQQGVFTVAHRGEPRIDVLGSNGEARFLWRFLIPPEAKESILKELSILGFERFQLFPELTSIADGINS